MGNTISYCLVQQVHTVRVMRSDGEVLEFDRPVIARQLMKVYPDHLVVHCSQVRRAGSGQRSKVSMLRADDTLALGQTYCLLRVPNTQLGKNGLLPRNPSLKGLQGVDSTTQQGQNIIHHRLPPLAPLEQPHFGGPWKPHLDAIIESPLNSSVPSRSMTMLPLARQAGYVPMSPARVAPSPRRAEELPVRNTCPPSEKFNRLSWASNAGLGEEFSLGIIAGGLMDGSMTLWNPAKLLSGDGDDATDSIMARPEKHSGALAYLFIMNGNFIEKYSPTASISFAESCSDQRGP